MKQIGTLGTIDTLSIGGRIFTDLVNLVILYGDFNGGGNLTLRKANGSSGYTPSGIHTFKMAAARVWSANGVAAQIQVGYSSNDVGPNGSATALTGFTMPGLSSSMFNLSAIQSAGSIVECVLDFVVPNGQFVSSVNSGGGNANIIQIFGYEQ